MRFHVLAVCAVQLLAGPIGLAGQGALSPDSAKLAAIVDSVIAARMAAERIPGAVFIMIEDGRLLYARGYGYADLASRRAMHPDSTLVRIGSISKLFTATALMQLVDRRRVGLDQDVNRYLKQVRVPANFGVPVTPVHLLNHTAGFDEIRPGTQAASEAQVQPLSEFLAGRLVRVRPPGEIPSYSTYGITLAGALIADVSGQPFETYLREQVLRPLGMHDTAITLGSQQRARLLVPYEISGDQHLVQPYEWYHTTPASSLNSTAADMGRFIIAHLNDGKAGEAAILSAPVARRMREPSARGHPDVPGVALGFFEGDCGGERVLEHGGTVAGTSTLLVLLPNRRAGFFVASQLEGNTLRDGLKQAILERYFMATAKPFAVPATTWAPPIDAFAGTYRWNVYCHTCGRAAPNGGPAVVANPDGSLSFAGQRWLRGGPLLFRRDDGRSVLGFRQSRGVITHLFIDGPLTFERIN